MYFWPEDLLEFSMGGADIYVVPRILALHWPIATLLEITDKNMRPSRFPRQQPDSDADRATEYLYITRSSLAACDRPHCPPRPAWPSDLTSLASPALRYFHSR